MDSSTPPQADRSVVVGLFEREPQARQAVQGLRGLGTAERDVGLLAPGLGSDATPDLGRLLSVAAADGGDITSVLVSLGVPEGEARFYAQEACDGRALLIVDAHHNFEAARDVVLRHGGYDVQSRGGDLAHAHGAGVAGGS